MDQDHITLLNRLETLQLSTDDCGRANFGSNYANKTIQVLMREEVTDLDEIPVYHGVHDTGVIDDELRAKLFTKYFGMHWFQGPHAGRWRFEKEQKKYDENDDLPNRKPLSDWKNCNALATHGGLLTLRDTRYEPKDVRLMRISFVLPQTIMPLAFEHNQETHYLKTIEVHSPASFVVTDDEYPELFGNIAPRLGTIQKWDKHIDVPRRVYQDLIEGS